MRLPTASALDRARICPGSACLPRVGEINDGMTAGTARHLYLQRVLELGGIEHRAQALEVIEDETLRAMCAALDLEGLPLDPAAYAAEVTYAWHVETGEVRELGRGLGRDYSAAGPDEIVGTADTVALVGTDAVFVSDFKSRWDSITPLERNLQLRFLGLAAARAYGRDRALLEIIRPGEERAWREQAELGFFDLVAVEEELRELVAGVRRSAADVPVLVVGDHCRRCACNRYCPAQIALPLELAGAGGESLIASYDRALTPERAGELVGRIKAARAALDRIEAACEGVAWTTPGGVPLGDGRVWAPVQRRYESVVGNIGWKVIEQLHGRELAWKASKLEITKAALERLAESDLVKLTGKKKTHVVRDLLAEIDRAGGLKVKVQDELRVHRPKGGA